jgi:hypothetical protein
MARGNLQACSIRGAVTVYCFERERAVPSFTMKTDDLLASIGKSTTRNDFH